MTERERWDFLRVVAPEAVAAAEDFTSSMEWLLDETGRDSTTACLALADEARRVIDTDRAAGWERIRHDADVIAAHLTETLLPADMRAAGVRIAWEEQR